MLLKTGQTAPDFILPDADMQEVALRGLLGHQHVILFFYPRDGTPSCTLEATDFSDHAEDFARAGCLLLGVSRDDCLKHAEFRDREGIAIPLLSDADGAVCKRYGVWQAREVDGHRKFGIARSTFVIDRGGLIRHALYNVNHRGHAAEMLRLAKELKNEHAGCQEHRRHA